MRGPGRERIAPRDVDYFAELKMLHTQFPKLHDDFSTVFMATGKAIDARVSQRISELAAHYPAALRPDVEVLRATLYAAMIAEENRAHASETNIPRIGRGAY